MTTIAKVTRRHWLIGATGAAVLAGAAGLWLGVRPAPSRSRPIAEPDGTLVPNAYLAIEPGGDIVVWLIKSEMGQGVATALPMIVAEELDADWERVRIEQAVARHGHGFGSLFTAASTSVRSHWIDLRRAGASARHLLVAAAAERWNVAAGELATRDSAVLHAASGRVATYGELAADAARQRSVRVPRLKEPRDFRLVGRSIPRGDVPGKVLGSAIFGLDVRLPGMLFGVIARSPSFGARVDSVDDTAALRVPGVIAVLRVPSGVGVVATTTHAALRGREALRIAWEPQTVAGADDTLVAESLRAAVGDQMAGGRDEEPSSPRRPRVSVTAIYEVPYLAHAPMEPMNCVADVAHGACTVWAPTQSPDLALEAAARTAGLPRESVTVHTTLLGGSFGRRTATDYVEEAVDLSARLQRPVQVVWSREDDMRHSQYRPAAAQRIDAVVEPAGRPRAWRHRIATAVRAPPPPGDDSATMGADDLPYDVGRAQVDFAPVMGALPTTIWRSVGHSYTTFAIESFVDELAAAVKEDPLLFRQRLSSDARLTRCLAAVAEMCGWESRAQRWLGIAAARCFGSYIATVAEVVPSAGGGLRVHHLWCAVDCGVVVHPDGAVAQIEGGVLFGLTAALYGKVTVRDGAVLEGNFDTYRVLRFDEAPAVSVQFIATGEYPGGVGELGVPVIAPAVANALFAARGQRQRVLPLSLA